MHYQDGVNRRAIGGELVIMTAHHYPNTKKGSDDKENMQVTAYGHAVNWEL